MWCICLFVTGYSRWIKLLYRPLQQDRCVLATRICFIVTKVGHRARERERAGLDPVASPHPSTTTSNTWGMDNIHVNGPNNFQWVVLWRVWMCLSGKYAVDRASLRVGRVLARMFALFDLGLPQWHLRCWYPLFKAQPSVLHFQGMLTAVLTFPFDHCSCLSHSQSFASSVPLSKNEVSWGLKLATTFNYIPHWHLLSGWGLILEHNRFLCHRRFNFPC